MSKTALLREDYAFKKYIAECDEFAIVPDVAGAFHWVWEKFSKLDQKQTRQITDLILPEGFCVSSPLESSEGFFQDIEHRFQVSDGERRIGVVIILTEVRVAPVPAQAEKVMQNIGEQE